MPKSHMSSDRTTSWWPAVELRWRLWAILQTGMQSPSRYRAAVPMRQLRVKMMTILEVLRHTKPVEIVMHQLRQAAVWLSGTCQNVGCCVHRMLQFAAPARTTCDITKACRRRLHGEHPQLTNCLSSAVVRAMDDWLSHVSSALIKLNTQLSSPH